MKYQDMIDLENATAAQEPTRWNAVTKEVYLQRLKALGVEGDELARAIAQYDEEVTQ